MPPEKKLLVSRDIWRTAWTTLQSTGRQTLLLLIFGLIVPQIILNLVLDFQSTAVVTELRAIFTSKMASTGSPVAFRELLGPALAYFSRLGLVILLILLPFLASFLALVYTAVDHHRQQPGRGALKAWWAGLRATARAIVAMFITLLVLWIFGQVFLAPALVVGVLALLIPVLLIAEHRGAWETLWSAMTMKYAQTSGYSTWTVFFNLISLSAFFYAGLAATGLMADGLLFLDERFGLSREVWTMRFSGQPFGPVYIAIALVETVLSMTLLAAIPALTAALYFTVRRGAVSRPIAQA